MATAETLKPMCKIACLFFNTEPVKHKKKAWSFVSFLNIVLFQEWKRNLMWEFVVGTVKKAPIWQLFSLLDLIPSNFFLYGTSTLSRTRLSSFLMFLILLELYRQRFLFVRERRVHTSKMKRGRQTKETKRYREARPAALSHTLKQEKSWIRIILETYHHCSSFKSDRKQTWLITKQSTYHASENIQSNSAAVSVHRSTENNCWQQLWCTWSSGI